MMDAERTSKVTGVAHSQTSPRLSALLARLPRRSAAQNPVTFVSHKGQRNKSDEASFGSGGERREEKEEDP